MPKAFGYCRLSKDETTVKCSACKMEWNLKIQNTEQTEFDCPFCQKTFQVNTQDPISIQAQTDCIQEVANTRLPRAVDPDMEIVADINVSGKVPIRDRPQGGILFQKMKTGDYLLIPRLDRAFRDLEDCCRQLKFFQRLGIHVMIGNMPDFDVHTSFGRMFIQQMALFAEFEREQISERTKAGLAKRKALGLPVNGEPPRGYAVKCTECKHTYSYAESRKGQFCPGCRIPRRGHTEHTPNPNEQQLMWRLLWERSGYMWKDWDMVAFDLNQDGHHTREGRQITVKWCRNYWESAVELLRQAEENGEQKLLVEYRPPKMENFTIHKIPNLPKHIAEKLEAKSRETPTKA